MIHPDEENRADSDMSRNAALRLLKSELTVAGIAFTDFLPTWARHHAVQGTVLSELLVALDAPVHEGMIPPYGSIILPNSVRDVSLRLDFKNLNLARQAADGSTALVTFQEGEFIGLRFFSPMNTPELELARASEKLNAISLRRTRDGVVRIFAKMGSLRHTGRQWTVSPPISRAIDMTLRTAEMLAPIVLRDLLDFAYYVLSPWYIGATLVWLLTENNPFRGGVDLRPLNLTLSAVAPAPPLSFVGHLLAQHDGATIISSAGRILSTGIQLSATRKAERIVEPFRGTRHTSAKRASFDHANTLIVTVSADGPVTIFSDGMDIFELKWRSAAEDVQATKEALGDDHEGVASSSTRLVACAKCGKNSDIQIFKVIGWTRREKAHCPVCGDVIFSAMSSRISANLKKTLSQHR